MLIFRLIKESFRFAMDSLIVNKLRTVLSLLGITIGIFAMISVFTVVGSLERSIRESIQSLGDNVVYIQQMPWQFDSNTPWWDYIRRPHPNLEDFKMVKKLTRNAEAVAMLAATNGTLEYKNNSIEGIALNGVTEEYTQIWDLQIVKGRYFTEYEVRNGRNVAIIGADIADNLFPGGEAEGKDMKFKGRKLTVIGVLEKEGESMMGQSNDKNVFTPLNFARNYINLNSHRSGSIIMVRAKEGVSNAELIDELTGVMRSIRKLKPTADDNFALNQLSMLTQAFDGLFGVLNMTGFIIGIFSIIVGGFSIANIMFVSVKERTPLIGIQKSLGAKNYFILLQFLFESIFLCLLGGAVGLLLIFFLSLVVSLIADFDVMLSMGNIVLGISISVGIGLISGIIPAVIASRLDPVEAIRS
ncbi:MAG: ABC transporter [Flavobacteriales bacterium]|nr:ABC transporter [Flavobacteriales bacterium]